MSEDRFSVVICDLVKVTREVSLPINCPKCSAKFDDKDYNNLYIQNLSFKTHRAWLDSDLDLILEECVDEDVENATSISCRSCNYVIVEGLVKEQFLSDLSAGAKLMLKHVLYAHIIESEAHADIKKILEE